MHDELEDINEEIHLEELGYLKEIADYKQMLANMKQFYSPFSSASMYLIEEEEKETSL